MTNCVSLSDGNAACGWCAPDVVVVMFGEVAIVHLCQYLSGMTAAGGERMGDDVLRRANSSAVKCDVTVAAVVQ